MDVAGHAGAAPAAGARGPAEILDRLVSRCEPAVFDGTQGDARLRLVVEGEGEWDAVLDARGARLEPARAGAADATIAAGRAAWESFAENPRGALDAYRSGHLAVRHNLHLGVAFLAATSGTDVPERLVFRRVRTASGPISFVAAGRGDPVILVHGLGATKVSFLPTVVALAPRFRALSLDLPGFGDSVKPVLAPYHAPFFARAVVDFMDAVGIERAHVVGNSMGGRVALELGLRHPDRVRDLVLVAPSLAWKRGRPFAPFVRVFRPELGLVQATPRWVFDGIVRRLIPSAAESWVHAGVDEFLRSYLTPRGRVAFYAAARSIYLEEPHGAKGFWTRLAGLKARCLFAWGRLDRLVPIGFARHVADVLPGAEHLELDCGHVPQLERPAELHRAMLRFLGRPG